MSDEQIVHNEVQSNGGGIALKVTAIILAIIAVSALALVISLRGRVADLETRAKSHEITEKALEEKVHLTSSELKTAAESLDTKVGLTQEQLEAKTAALRQAQEQQEENARRLKAAQQKTDQTVAGVSGEVSNVKSDLGGARSDIASTRTDLNATKEKLEKAIGDLGVQSGLIARNHDELEVLKHKGDRNYFEFTLRKKQRQAVANISLELRKTDPKKSKFTLNVMADDRTIEKKDRTMNEPLQFYTGRDRSLYEIVVFGVNKDVVTGYLSSPKN